MFKKDRPIPARTLVNIILLGGSIACCAVAEEVFGYGDTVGIVFLMIAFFLSATWGILFVMAIGGADMPVVICILNTGSGLAGVFRTRRLDARVKAS